MLALFAFLAIQADPLAPLHQPAPALIATATPLPRATRIANLRRQLATIAAASSGEVGITVLDPTTGESASVNGGRAFPMASTVKVAIAATYLAEVEAGHRTLADMIPVDDRLRMRSDGIVAFAPHAGVTLSAANLIELMLTRSDNTATDVLLANLGGPATVENWLLRNHVDGLRVDRSIAELLLDLRGARLAAGMTAAETLRRWDPVAPGSIGELDEPGNRPTQNVAQDLRDTASPAAFANFLHRLYKAELLTPASRDFLFSVMRRCITGANRIKGMLPPATPVEHKTGTLNGVTDDVGFVTLPDGHRLIVSAFAQGGSDRPTLIARAARAAYDAFTPPR